MIRTRKGLIVNNLKRRPNASARKILDVDELLAKITSWHAHPKCEEVHASGDCQCANLFAKDARDVLGSI